MDDHISFESLIDKLGASAALRVAMLSLEHCSDAIYWFDGTARVVYANQAACRALGYAGEELVGLIVTDLNPTYPADPVQVEGGPHRRSPDGDSAPLPPWLKALLVAGTASQTYETVHRRKDGRLLPVEVLRGADRDRAAAASSSPGTRRVDAPVDGIGVQNIASELGQVLRGLARDAVHHRSARASSAA